MIKHLCQTLGSFTYLTEATVKAKEILGVECVQSEFWKIVITTWLDFDESMYVIEFESEEERIRKQLLFYNTEVRYKNKPLLIKKWIMIYISNADWELMEKH